MRPGVVAPVYRCDDAHECGSARNRHCDAPTTYFDARRTMACALNEPATFRVSALPLAEK